MQQSLHFKADFCNKEHVISFVFSAIVVCSLNTCTSWYKTSFNYHKKRHVLLTL